MTDQIRLKRTIGSGPPATLAFGEPAYSDGDQSLHIGTADGGTVSLPAAAAPVDHGHPDLATADHAHDYAPVNHAHPDLATADHAHDYAPVNHAHPDMATADHAHDYAPVNHGHPDLALATHSHPASSWQFLPLALAPGWQEYPTTTARLAYSVGGPPLCYLSAVLQHPGSAPAGPIAQIPGALRPSAYQVFGVTWLGSAATNPQGTGGLALDEAGQLGWLKYAGNDSAGVEWLAFSIFWIPL